MTGKDVSLATTNLAERPVIRIIEIPNPLRASEQRLRWEHWEPGKPLIEYVPEDGNEYVVSVSGGIVPVDRWETLCPASDDVIVLCPVLHGGGGNAGKTILRIIAVIAIVVISIYTGGAAAAYFGSYLAGQVVAGVVMVAGMALVNSMMPVPGAQMPKLSGDLSESPSYGVNGPRNVSLEGIPVPVVYGKHRIAGNIVGLYTENVQKTQLVYMLICAGEGPIAGIRDIEINDQPLTNFKDVVTEIRLGTAEQDMIPWFADTQFQVDVGNPQLSTTPVERVTSREVDRIRVDTVCPYGLFQVNDKGEMTQTSVDVTIEYIRTDIDGNPLSGETWSANVGQLNVSGYETRFHYFYRLRYNPLSGEPAEVIQHEHDQDTLYPGDRLVVGDDGAWASGRNYTPNRVVQHNDATWLCTTSHTSAAYSEPGVGAGSNLNWMLCNQGVTEGDIVGTDGDKVGFQINRPQYQEPTYGFTTVSGKSRFPVRASFYTPALPQGYYKVRVKRNNAQSTDDKLQNEIHWELMGEIILDDVAYRNTALLGIKIRLSDQLQGVPNVTYVHDGVMTRYYDPVSDTWKNGSTGNPAWAVLDMLTNMVYGARVPWSMIDIDAFVQWAAHCDAQSPKLEFNCVLDQDMPFWDSLKYACRVGHAQITRVGTKFSVVVERKEDPVMMFSEANIVADTFNTSWLPLVERANSVEVTYFDREDGYKKKTLKVVSPTLTDLSLENVQPVTLLGVTSRTQALREGILQLNMNNYVTRTVSFDAHIEAIACTVGSVIYVKHVAQETAWSGRFAADSDASQDVLLDQYVTLQSGVTYSILFRNAEPVEINIGLVGLDATHHCLTSSLFSSVFGFVETYTEAAVKFEDGRSVRIARVDRANGKAYIHQDDPLTPDMASLNATLVASDWLSKFTVVPGTGLAYDVSINRVKLLEAVGSPAGVAHRFAHFVLGPVSEVRRKYRVISIQGGASEYTRTLSAIEYHPEVYDATTVLVPPGVGIPPQVAALMHVTNLQMEESEVAGGDRPRYQLELRWDKPVQGTYAGAEIYRKVDGEEHWQSFLNTNGATSVQFEAARDEILTLKVVAVDNAGKKPPFSSAPEITWIAGQAHPDISVDLISLDADAGFQQVTLKWVVNNPENLDRVEVYMAHGSDPEVPPPDMPLASTKIAVVSGLAGYVYTTSEAGSYRFWVKLVDKMGRVSDHLPNPGVTCAPTILVSDLIEQLQDEIYMSLLDQFLRSRIEIIPRLVDLDAFVLAVEQLLRLTELLHSNDASITRNETAIQDESSARAEAVTVLTASVEGAAAALLTEQSVRAEQDLAEARERTVLASAIGPPEIIAQLSSRGGLERLLNDPATGSLSILRNDLHTVATSTSATAEQVTTLQTFLVGGNFNGTHIGVGSYLYDREQALSELDQSLTTRITQNESSIFYLVNGGNPDNPGAPSLHEAYSRITNVETTTVRLDRDVNGANGPVRTLARQVSQLATSVNGFTTAVEQRLEIADYEASYSVRIDQNGYVSGFGLSSSSSPNGTPTSEFVVRADRFAVGTPTSGRKIPFIVSNIPGTNTPAVFIDTAFIKDASIDVLKVAGNVIPAIGTGSRSCSLNAYGGSTWCVMAMANFRGSIKSSVKQALCRMRLNVNGSPQSIFGDQIVDNMNYPNATSAFQTTCALTWSGRVSGSSNNLSSMSFSLNLNEESADFESCTVTSSIIALAVYRP